MLYPLRIPDAYGYSQTLPDRALYANGYLFVAEGGNVLTDPPPLDEPTREEISRLGGVSKVIVMTRDRAANANEIAARFGAAVVDRPAHREEVAPGLVAIRLPNQAGDAAFAINIAAQRTAIAGDALVGAPAGALSLGNAGASDVRNAALGLRRILRQNPDTLLVARGQSLFGGAYDALYRLLYASAGPEVHRINVDELDFRDERDERSSQPGQYDIFDAEVGFEIGARLLGYRVSTIPPGHRFCPLHSHAREEELFFVIDGTPSVRMLTGTIRCRKGDFVALPVGASGTHQLLNESDAPATVLLLARNEEFEACYYPDSDKLLVDMRTPIEARASIMVAGHPELDYFVGE